jgi:chromosomal replication initiator protein
MQNRQLQLELQQLMCALKGRTYFKALTPMHIVNAVCDVLKVSYSKLQSLQKTRDVSDARSIAAWLMRQNTELKLYEIGGLVGVTNHASVIVQTKKCESLSKYNKAFIAKKALVLERLGLCV